MLVELMQGVERYLAEKCPTLSVERSYSPQREMTELESNAADGVIRVFVVPPAQTGEDVLLSRRPTVKRNIGIDVGMIVKPRSWDVEEIDVLLNKAEDIRKLLWLIPPVEIQTPGYSAAVFTKMDDQFCGASETHSQLFVALFTARFSVNFQ